MAIFSYRAYNADGKTKKGTLQAGSERDARNALKGMKLFPTQIKEVRKRHKLTSNFSKRLTVQKLAVFSKQFSMLLQASIPYDTAFDMMIKQTKDPAMSGRLLAVRSKLIEGANLAETLEEEGFPPLLTSLVRTGENSGTLDVVMERLASYYDNAGKLKAKIMSVMVYPVFMVIFSFAVTMFMMTYVVPKITTLFENFGAQLPLMTRILIVVSDLIIRYWWLGATLLVVFVLALIQFLNSQRGKIIWDKFELKLPLWKSLRIKVINQRFSQTMGTLLKSGIDLKNALATAQKVLENSVYITALDRVIFNMTNQGMNLAQAMHNEKIFPEDMCQMVAIGEETASLDTMFEQVSLRYEREVTTLTDGAASLLEPVLIVIMGGAVGFIVVSILLPMLQLNQLVR